MKLYYCPQTRAFTSLWMMEEVGQPYELVRVDIRAPGHPTEAYKKINPMGKVAGFEDNGVGFGEKLVEGSLARRRPLAQPLIELAMPRGQQSMQHRQVVVILRGGECFLHPVVSRDDCRVDGPHHGVGRAVRPAVTT